MKSQSFGAVLWYFAPNFTIFSTTFAESRFAAHRKVELAQIFLLPESQWQGLDYRL